MTTEAAPADPLSIAREVILRPGGLDDSRLDRVFAARKSQWEMGRLLGLPFLLRFATRQLRIAHIEARCRAILNCNGTAISDAPAELAYDIDLPEEYAYAVEKRIQR